MQCLIPGCLLRSTNHLHKSNTGNVDLHLVSVVMSEIGTESPFTKTVVRWRYISKKQISHKHLDDNLVILVSWSNHLKISTFDRTQQLHSLRTGIHCCPFSNAPSFYVEERLVHAHAAFAPCDTCWDGGAGIMLSRGVPINEWINLPNQGLPSKFAHFLQASTSILKCKQFSPIWKLT